MPYLTHSLFLLDKTSRGYNPTLNCSINQYNNTRLENLMRTHIVHLLTLITQLIIWLINKGVLCVSLYGDYGKDWRKHAMKGWLVGEDAINVHHHSYLGFGFKLNIKRLLLLFIKSLLFSSLLHLTKTIKPTSQIPIIWTHS